MAHSFAIHKERFPPLEGRDIEFVREGKAIFPSLSFSLGAEETLIVKGPNGSGKSTLLRLMAGLLTPTKGLFTWHGNILSKQALASYQQEILYIGHKLSLHPDGCLKDQIQLWKRLYRIPECAILAGLEAWEVSDLLPRKISHLSEGQRKRASLSRCHWLQRSLWILDEPHGGLDQDGRERLVRAIEAHLRKGGSVVLATHEDYAGTQEVRL